VVVIVFFRFQCSVLRHITMFDGYCGSLYCEMLTAEEVGGWLGWTLLCNFSVGWLEMLYNVIQGGAGKIANFCIM